MEPEPTDEELSAELASEEASEDVPEEEISDEASDDEISDEVPDVEVSDEELDGIEEELVEEEIDEDNLTKDDYRQANQQIEKYREEFPEESWEDILNHYKSKREFSPSVKAAIVKICQQHIDGEEDDDSSDDDGSDEGSEGGVQAAGFSDEALELGREWVKFGRQHNWDNDKILAMAKKDFKEYFNVVEFLVQEPKQSHEEVRQDVINNKRHLNMEDDELKYGEPTNKLSILPVRS